MPDLDGIVSSRKLVIAIDGPAASGKSTTARAVARRLGYLHLDTGAMYRAVAAKVLRLGLDPTDAVAIELLLPGTVVDLRRNGDELTVLLDGRDVTEEIRSPGVTRAVSAVSSIPAVRDAMVRQQREMGRRGGVVLEGRDIGTVVFPDADLKVYMVAGLEARARRRQRELDAAGIVSTLPVLQKEIEERDRYDSTRSTAPLRKAEDAVLLDTSNLTVEEQVDAVVGLVKRIMKGTPER